MPDRYCLYALIVESNRPFTGLAPVAFAGEADLRIVFDETSGDGPGDAPAAGSIGVQVSRDQDGSIRLSYWGFGERTEAVVDAEGASVRITSTSGRFPEDVYATNHTAVLLGSVLPSVLRLRGMLCLHGAVVDIRGAAVVLLGEKGAGKSTCAAALLARGCSLVADDAAVLDDRQGFSVRAGYPRLRLWRSSVEALLAERSSASSLPRVLHHVDKHYVDLATAPDGTAWRFQPNPVPLAAIYLLARTPAAATPRIEPIGAAEALKALLSHRSMGDLPVSPAISASEFSRLGRVADGVPVRRVTYPDRFEDVDALAAAIIEDARPALVV
jgi:hypothetical protein